MKPHLLFRQGLLIGFATNQKGEKENVLLGLHTISECIDTVSSDVLHFCQQSNEKFIAKGEKNISFVLY